MMKIEKINVTYDMLVAFQVKQGCNESVVRVNSIPQRDLNKLLPYLQGQGLQIGGFLGIAHCYLASQLYKRATIWTVDPNNKHCGIKQPFKMAYEMVKHFNLLRNSVLITNFANEQIQIFQTCNMIFDFIILDGNHDKNQVAHEVRECAKILKTNGFLILDDIDHWQGPKKVYNDLNSDFKKIPLTSRIGLLQKL